jgi:flavorubredoxin
LFILYFATTNILVGVRNHLEVKPDLRKAIVIYDSKYGNTEKIAEALSEGMKKEGIDVDCLRIDKVVLNKLAEYDILAIGAPTQGFGISKPMKEFLKKLENLNLRDKKAFAFDTKLKSRFAGSAAKGIEKQLKKLNMTIIKPYASAIVKGTEGPLEEDAEKRFTQIGSEIAKK